MSVSGLTAILHIKIEL